VNPPITAPGKKVGISAIKLTAPSVNFSKNPVPSGSGKSY